MVLTIGERPRKLKSSKRRREGRFSLFLFYFIAIVLPIPLTRTHVIEARPTLILGNENKQEKYWGTMEAEMTLMKCLLTRFFLSRCDICRPVEIFFLSYKVH